MHICADEIMAASTALSAALPFIPRFRAFLKRLFLGAIRPFSGWGWEWARPDCTCRECVPCKCAGCVTRRGGLDAEAADLKIWLDNVAPLLKFNDTPWNWERRTLSDGSGFLVNGRIFPFAPTPPDADYERVEGRGLIRKVS